MTDKKRIDEGYSPSRVKKGYQPKKPSTPKPEDGGEVTGGYQPSTSEGDNPGNKSPPKKP